MPPHQIRPHFKHPIVDGDGHMIEYWPYLKKFLKAEGVDQHPEFFMGGARSPFSKLPPDERIRRRESRQAFWTLPTRDARDFATAMIPKLLYERMGEIGLDFAIGYPSMGLQFMHIDDTSLRRACCRAYNRYIADVFRDLRNRIEPVAIIPAHTPEEAITALEDVVGLGLKAILFPSYVRRPVEAARALSDHANMSGYAYWHDFFGIDSIHDYDPFWARCVDLNVSVATHSSGQGWGSRRSISNYVYNHIGSFGATGEGICKALFLGGVTRRFPTLRFGMLEGGVAWAASLYADLISHWNKRNRHAIFNYDPSNLDHDAFSKLLQQYGGPFRDADPSNFRESLLGFRPAVGAPGAPEAVLDEFAACGIERAEDIRDLFVPNFYFGCEADDPMVATAFATGRNPFGTRLKAFFGSDIGHWDVPRIDEVVEEAWEPVEHGWITEADFRSFAFENPVRFYTDTNPDFFAGTDIEKAVSLLCTKSS